MPAKIISVVIPFFNERQNIPIIASEIIQIFNRSPYAYEIIFVDDGSTDGSCEAARTLVERHSTVRLIEFSRNFGKEAATTAGFNAAIGDAAICLDADLQHPPALIPAFLKKWETGADVVIGVRDNDASDTGLKRAGSRIYYKVMNAISETEIIPRATDFRLLDRKVVDRFNALTERGRMTRGLIDWLGFRREYIRFKAPERQYGEASYSIHKLFRLAVSSFASHSLIPLRLAGYIGLLIMILSGILGIVMGIDRYFMPLGFNFSGPAILANINLFLVGLVLVSLGLLAYYIGQIFSETQNRPLYVVRNEYKRQNKI